MKENERECALFPRNTGVPPRRALQNAHFPREKVRNVETTKMGHLRTLFQRDNWVAALECVVFSRPECLFRMFIISQGIREPPWRGANFFRMCIIPKELGELPGGDPVRGD